MIKFGILCSKHDCTTIRTKTEGTQTPDKWKDAECSLHVIQFEGVISIKRVNDSYLPTTQFTQIHT